MKSSWLEDQKILIESSSIEVEQEHIVVTDWHGRIGGNDGHIHIVWL